MAMKGFKQGLAASVLALFVFTLTVKAEDRKLIEKKPATQEPTTEKEFLARAIATDIAEIKFAETALKQTSNKDVERFARRMRDDHTKNRDNLVKRARDLKLAVLEGLDKEHQDELNRLSKLEGSAFDREYARCMVEGHEKALNMYVNWADKAKDTELSTQIKQTIPTLKEHLQMARDLSNKLKS